MPRRCHRALRVAFWAALSLGGSFFSASHPATAQVSPIIDEPSAQGTGKMMEAEPAVEPERRRDMRHVHRRYKEDRPGEFYVAGFGGYTIGHGFDNVEVAGPFGSNINTGDRDLKDSGVYGLKLGYFLPQRLDWLGFEVEGFNTTPHIKQSDIDAGHHLRVTTLAFNAIARFKTMCEQHDQHGTRRASDESVYRYHEFCRLQPYAGVGLGVFFAHVSDATRSASDNAVPGLNVLAGLRFFMTERVALFGEYKYNRATLEFDNVGVGGILGAQGDYSASHIVGGLSLHF
jgi:opacity protein-like surface antigen